MATAVVTGGSRGLGRALVGALVGRGWTVVTDGRDRLGLDRLGQELGAGPGTLVTEPGDVADPSHRAGLARVVEDLGPGLDLLVNNAGGLGPSPLPPLSAYPLDALEALYRLNVVAPLGLIQELLPALRAAAGRILNITSDAAVEAYPGWGGYGSSKAALEALTAVIGAEETGVSVYSVDPGDLRTDMHQAAFPGEDISDRPWPETALPGLFALIDGRHPGGRYRASELSSEPPAGARS
jgi:NAD(P)-dependent dehydrogenase (short-subunit alcohol dehydrogenase family)